MRHFLRPLYIKESLGHLHQLEGWVSGLVGRLVGRSVVQLITWLFRFWFCCFVVVFFSVACKQLFLVIRFWIETHRILFVCLFEAGRMDILVGILRQPRRHFVVSRRTCPVRSVCVTTTSAVKPATDRKQSVMDRL